ncbi:hypothetical protein [Porphyrobacter sp. AAP60]|uniref:hypothetical protein n=1 Tax=Porphyrobacter sp. AAP60 TaxID=1523423 RepID=UPI0006CC1D3C|nr:hypothetical protein [Porphyrobacter sp. AAP60]KPF63506.1 hypothetical protein IP79_06090 [Porphyrobacter sp. AAP60]
MRKILTFVAVAGGALALAACEGKTAEEPAAPAETEMMAPAAEPVDEAAAAAADIDPTSNPIRPAEAPMTEAGAAPAAE